MTSVGLKLNRPHCTIGYCYNKMTLDSAGCSESVHCKILVDLVIFKLFVLINDTPIFRSCKKNNFCKCVMPNEATTFFVEYKSKSSKAGRAGVAGANVETRWL